MLVDLCDNGAKSLLLEGFECFWFCETRRSTSRRPSVRGRRRARRWSARHGARSRRQGRQPGAGARADVARRGPLRRGDRPGCRGRSIAARLAAEGLPESDLLRVEAATDRSMIFVAPGGRECHRSRRGLLDRARHGRRSVSCPARARRRAADAAGNPTLAATCGPLCRGPADGRPHGVQSLAGPATSRRSSRWSTCSSSTRARRRPSAALARRKRRRRPRVGLVPAPWC